MKYLSDMSKIYIKIVRLYYKWVLCKPPLLCVVARCQASVITMEAERCAFFGPLPLVYIPTVADRRRLSPIVAESRR